MTESKIYRRKRNVIQRGTEPMLSIKAISEKYGFHPHTIRAWVNRDGLKHVKHGPGGKVFIRQNDVEAFIKQWYQEYGHEDLLSDVRAKDPEQGGGEDGTRKSTENS